MKERSDTRPARSRSRLAVAGIAAALLATGGATAYGSGGHAGQILDQGKYYPAGSLDDGKQWQGDAKISLDRANGIAQHAASGDLGQVDLDHAKGVLVYKVDVGSQEVWVDAADGSVVSVQAQE